MWSQDLPIVHSSTLVNRIHNANLDDIGWHHVFHNRELEQSIGVEYSEWSQDLSTVHSSTLVNRIHSAILHLYWVRSGNFGHQVNSDIHLQTVEIQMRRLLMSRLIRIFTVCLVN